MMGNRLSAIGYRQAPAGAGLRRHDCDFAQGYRFARPMPADALAAWMREQRFL